MNLNLITDSGAENLRTFHEKALREGAEGPFKYEAHRHLGLLAWRAGDADATREHLSAAAKQAIDLYSQAGDPPTPRQPNDFDMPLMLTLAFGDDELKERLAALPRQNWFRPENAEYQPLADLFDILRAFPKNKKADVNAIRKLRESNDRPAAQHWYRPWIRAMSDGLLAIDEKNKKGVESAIQVLLQRHEKEADEGDWKLLVEGLMATWALVLYRFARDSGIDVEIESPYFPKDPSF
jgi:hypothetical protein